VLALCGAVLLWEARTAAFARWKSPMGAEHGGHWPAFVWVSAGLLLNAALITTLGFILSCTLCYVLAVQGCAALRRQAARTRAHLGGWTG
jgi:putative tricarboxylic transport membrane protein